MSIARQLGLHTKVGHFSEMKPHNIPGKVNVIKKLGLKTKVGHVSDLKPKY